MKRLITFLFFLCIIPALGLTSDITNDELAALTVDELLALQSQINSLLTEKGYQLYTDISHGDKGDHVTRLQERLTNLGFYSGKISGKYDTETEKAVKQFQKSNGFDSSGMATQELQELLFSSNAGLLITSTPKPTFTPAPSLDPSFSGYTSLSYQECARYPDKYTGTKVKLDGKVLQVLGSKDTGFEIRLATSGSSDIYYIKIPKGIVDYNILEDDRLTIYAVMSGTRTYTSTLRVSITIPYAVADAVILK